MSPPRPPLKKLAGPPQEFLPSGGRSPKAISGGAHLAMRFAAPHWGAHVLLGRPGEDLS
jgi:hypothetical protein